MNNVTLAPERASAPVPQLSHGARIGLADGLRRSGYLTAFEIHGGDPARAASPRLEVLRRLFIAGQAVARTEAESALPVPLLEEFIDAGLLEESASGIRSVFQVQIYRGLIILADFLSPSGPSDLVLPIGPSGRYLAGSTVRRPVRSALDLGCGCGIQALLAARHSEGVTATDINPRALALTALNAAINSIGNIELLEGSYLEPVAGRAFDLITCNLPYVITPENKFLYRDSGEAGDLPVWRVVGLLPRHLERGGYAHIMVNWTHAASEAWWTAFRTRMSSIQAEAWLMCHQTLAPEPYARMWTDFKQAGSGQPDDEKLKRWLAWYRSQGIERISLGMLTLRRNRGANHWHCAAEVRSTLTGDTGEQLHLLFELQEYLASLGSRHALLEGVFARQNIALHAGRRSGSVMACTAHGYLFQCSIQSASARVLDQLNGAANLRTAIQRAGEGFDGDPALDVESILGDFHTLMCFGMIRPA